MWDDLPGVAFVCHFDAMNSKFIRNVFQVLQSLCIGSVVFTHFGVICVLQHADKFYERVLQHLKNRLKKIHALVYPPEIDQEDRTRPKRNNHPPPPFQLKSKRIKCV